MVDQDLRDKKPKKVRSKIQVRQKLHFNTDVTPYALSFGINMFCTKFSNVVTEGWKKTELSSAIESGQGQGIQTEIK